MLIQGAQPNAAHRKLAELEQAGKLKAVVTQNTTVSIRLPEARWSMSCMAPPLRNYCTRCKKKYPVSFLLETTGIPGALSPTGGAIVRPDVVLL